MTSPTPTPPCLGEREAVARTGERQAILWLVRVGRLTRSDSATMTDAIIAQHIEPLRTENETLTAKLAQAEGEIATMRGALKLAENPLSYRNANGHGAPGSHAVATALAAVRAVLSPTENADA